MKRSACLALELALLLFLSGCGQEKQASASPAPSQAASSAPTPSPPATPPLSSEAEEEPMFPRSFNFGSGSGGWGTEVTIAEDGSFTGYHRDSDADAIYYCHFTGKFSAPEQVDDHTYSMRLESLEEEEPEDEERIDEYGVRWVASYAYGMETGEEYLLYLPGKPVADLPEPFVMWAAHGYDYGSWDGETLPGYGLYNVETEYGFSECQPKSIEK